MALPRFWRILPGSPETAGMEEVHAEAVHRVELAQPGFKEERF